MNDGCDVGERDAKKTAEKRGRMRGDGKGGRLREGEREKEGESNDEK